VPISYAGDQGNDSHLNKMIVVNNRIMIPIKARVKRKSFFIINQFHPVWPGCFRESVRKIVDRSKQTTPLRHNIFDLVLARLR
jgi:hypothetical protein